jgi:ssDNA-binding Zn-finger/Zn-ribbon topoisomerase 1
MNVPSCGECGGAMTLKRSRFGPFWSCSRWPDCGGTHGAHPDGSPLGVPADKATKLARIAAHDAFDELWRGEHAPMKRKEAYRWMQEVMGLASGECHIGRFPVSRCSTLVRLVESHLDARHIRQRRDAGWSA